MGNTLFNGKLKIAGIVTMVGSFFAILVAWHTLGFPTLATSNDLNKIEHRIQSIEQFNKDTRLLLLNQEWERLRIKISELESRMSDDSPIKAQMLANLESQLRLVKQQMDDLK